MNKKKLTMIASIVTATAILINVAVFAIPGVKDTIKEAISDTIKDTLKDTALDFLVPDEEKNDGSKAENASVISENDGLVNKTSKGAIDISSITLTNEEEDLITSSDSENKDKNIKNFKTIIAKLDIPDEYRKQIIEQIKKGYKTNQILAAYEFLNENYGSINEIGTILDSMKKRKKSNEAFKDYTKSKGEFVPTNFEHGVLDDLMNNFGMTPDDIMIADRVSQSQKLQFYDVINKKVEGKSWKEIKKGYGIINQEEKLPKIGVTNAQINNLMQSNNLTEKQVVEGIVMANKLNRSESEILSDIKKGMDKEDIYAQCLDEEYK